jgi:hypothetical protein
VGYVVHLQAFFANILIGVVPLQAFLANILWAQNAWYNQPTDGVGVSPFADFFANILVGVVHLQAFFANILVGVVPLQAFLQTFWLLVTNYTS